jgi:hypothetical protein
MIEISPWVTFSLNLSILFCLLAFAVQLNGRATERGPEWKRGMLWRQVSDSQRGAVVGVVVLGLCLVGWEYGGRYFTFDSKKITTELVELKRLEVGVESSFLVIVKNKSAVPARIVGVETSCDCVAADAVGRQVVAHSSVEIPIAVTPNKTGYFHQKMRFFIDHPEQFRVNVDVFGSVF